MVRYNTLDFFDETSFVTSNTFGSVSNKTSTTAEAMVTTETTAAIRASVVGNKITTTAMQEEDGHEGGNEYNEKREECTLVDRIIEEAKTVGERRQKNYAAAVTLVAGVGTAEEKSAEESECTSRFNFYDARAVTKDIEEENIMKKNESVNALVESVDALVLRSLGAVSNKALATTAARRTTLKEEEKEENKKTYNIQIVQPTPSAAAAAAEIAPVVVNTTENNSGTSSYIGDIYDISASTMKEDSDDDGEEREECTSIDRVVETNKEREINQRDGTVAATATAGSVVAEELAAEEKPSCSRFNFYDANAVTKDLEEENIVKQIDSVDALVLRSLQFQNSIRLVEDDKEGGSTINGGRRKKKIIIMARPQPSIKNDKAKVEEKASSKDAPGIIFNEHGLVVTDEVKEVKATLEEEEEEEKIKERAVADEPIFLVGHEGIEVTPEEKEIKIIIERINNTRAGSPSISISDKDLVALDLSPSDEAKEDESLGAIPQNISDTETFVTSAENLEDVPPKEEEKKVKTVSFVCEDACDELTLTSCSEDDEESTIVSLAISIDRSGSFELVTVTDDEHPLMLFFTCGCGSGGNHHNDDEYVVRNSDAQCSGGCRPVEYVYESLEPIVEPVVGRCGYGNDSLLCKSGEKRNVSLKGRKQSFLNQATLKRIGKFGSRNNPKRKAQIKDDNSLSDGSLVDSDETSGAIKNSSRAEELDCRIMCVAQTNVQRQI